MSRVPAYHLFAEWERDEQAHGPQLLKRVAGAIVLTRLGALLHDLCHVPFGHSVEDELRLLDPHDENRDRFESLWVQIDPVARTAIEGGRSLAGKGLLDDILPIVLSGLQKPASTEEGQDPGVADLSYPFVQDIVGNTISADLMDYLTRDHVFTGFPRPWAIVSSTPSTSRPQRSFQARTDGAARGQAGSRA